MGGELTPSHDREIFENSGKKMAGADLAFFQGGGLTHRAASRFFFFLFYEPRSGEPIFFFAILRAAKRRADFFWLFYEPRSGEPIFFGYFTSREAASRFFWGYFEPP